MIVEDQEIEDHYLEPELIEKEDKNIKYLKLFLKLLLWSLLNALFIRLEFGIVYLVVSSLVLICLNTNVGKKKKGTVSAYSVFNPNLERLPGQLTSEQIEKSLIGAF